jgi:predicted enzyme related to lactoylglutathione lyase
MLDSGTITANLPAADLARAKGFYADTLGLQPVQELGEDMLVYRTSGGSVFSVYRTEYAGTAGHTLAQWHVEDVDAEVKALQDKGVTFEEYDMPGVEWSNGVASMPGMGKAAWFKDTEGNILCIDDGLPGV